MNVFARLKIGQRLYLGFAAVLVLLIGITALAWNGLNTSHNATERIVMMKERAANTEEWLLSTQLNINRVLAVAKSGNNPAVDSYFKPMIANTTARINEVQKLLEAEITSESGKALLVEIADKRSAYIATRTTYFDTVKAGDVAGADQILNTGLMPAADVYSGKQKELLDFQNGLVKEAVEASDATIKSQIALLMGLAAAAIALAMVMAWRITRSVTQPLAEALAMSRDVAAGNLTRQINTSRADELGDLLRALAEMQSSLVNTVTQVRSTTDSINIASAEIASGNQDLSARTEQTASNLEETAASMEQLTSTVRQSADSARQANQLASSASEIAVRGGNVVGQVVTTMNEINASSKKISDIIGVIDGIAFQTNILALNAAVEAARAGEQGRGFAVVAAEVRSLAQRSAEAAKEIKGLISSSVDRVEAGSRLVGEAGQTMSELVGSVQRVSDIIGEITAAASEQSDGIGQVNVAVNQLDQMTQQNAALVEESAAAAESLRDQATRLAQVVQIFRIDGLVSQALPAPSAPGLKAQPRKALAPARPLGVAPRQPVLAQSRPAPVKKSPAPGLQESGKPTTTATAATTAASGDEGDWESF
jgi:methyl-accepting chemotaxis protein